MELFLASLEYDKRLGDVKTQKPISTITVLFEFASVLWKMHHTNSLFNGFSKNIILIFFNNIILIHLVFEKNFLNVYHIIKHANSCLVREQIRVCIN